MPSSMLNSRFLLNMVIKAGEKNESEGKRGYKEDSC